MATTFLSRVIDWLREGYPGGIPAKDTLPLLVLLRRRLTQAEVEHVAAELRRQGLIGLDRADIGTEITKVVDDVPHPQDLDRVARALAFRGFPSATDG